MHRLPLVAAVVAALAATPPDASANVSCEFGGSVLNVRLSGESARATLTVAPEGAIVVSDSDLEPRECTGAVPTVNSTAAVSVVNEPGMRGTALTIRRAGRFGPGPSSADENGGSPEIELFVNSKDDPQSFVTVEADDAAGSATCCPRPRPSPSPLGAATGGSPRSAPTAWPPPTHGGSGSPS